jgi:hypothetical protein
MHSPIQISRPCSSQDNRREMQDHSYCSSLDKTSLVRKSTCPLSIIDNASGFSHWPGDVLGSCFRKVFLSEIIPNRSQACGWSLSGERWTTPSLNWDRRFRSTSIVYDGKWTIFSDWCVGREIDPFKISVQQLANVLVFLFEVKGLAPSTVKGHISAISRTIHISGREDFVNNEFIFLLVRNFNLERPRQRVLVHQWNLDLVLSALILTPFEPAEEVDLKFTSKRKTRTFANCWTEILNGSISLPTHQSEKIVHFPS